MSSRPPLPPPEAELAADLAAGLLDGDDHVRASRLYREHPGFRAEVERWTHLLTPMLDEVEPVEPPSGLFDAIEQRLGRGQPANDTAPLAADPSLQMRLRRWQWFGSSAAAIAAALALVMVTTPTTAPIAPPPAVAESAPMVASIAGEGSGRMVAVWSAPERKLVVAAAAPIDDTPGKAHELWLIPKGGSPKSMGVMPKGTMHAVLPEPMADAMKEGAMLAISLEPMGGSPTGAPTGPVIASGMLQNG